jgi:hypothetical protein
VSSSLFFFIVPTFFWGCRAGTDNSDPVTSFYISYDHEPITVRHSKEDVPHFTYRVFWVWNCQGKRIAEGCCCLREGHVVLLLVR